jgi:branched-chain amino acid transport system substrate-binding protein
MMSRHALASLRTFARPASAVALVALLCATATAASADPPASKAAAIVADAAGDRDVAIRELQAALVSAPAADAPALQLFLAEQLRLVGDPRGSAKLFKAAAKGDPDLARGAEVGQIALAGFDRLDDSGAGTLRSVAEDGLPDSLNAERHVLLAAWAARRDQAGPAGEHARAALRFGASDPAVDADVRARLRALLTGDLPPPATAGGSDDVTALDRAVAAGDRDRVAALAARLRERAAPGSDLAAIAAYAERRVDAPVQPRIVGVLLPQSGRLRGVGAQMQRALELGWQAGGGTVKLVVADAGDNEEQTIKALEKLVLVDGAIAVIGPLSSDVADRTAQVANALRVPLIGLHQSSTASADRPWVYDGLTTPGAQARALVDYVMEHRGMKSFAIFAPDNPYGHGAADAFTAAVLARGGRISAREHYSPDSNDLIPFAKKLGRKDYNARAAEFRRIRSDIAEAGGDPSRAVLPPVMDFDAIFVPDGHRRISVAAAGLAYEEFPIGQFRIKKDGPAFPLLGLSGWNHPELVTSGGPYVRDSLFVDVWLPDSGAARPFTASYRAETGREPNALEAQAWTVGLLVGKLGRDLTTRESALARLGALRVDATATGATGVDTTERRVAHAIRILTLDKDGIREVRVRAPEPGSPEP